MTNELEKLIEKHEGFGIMFEGFIYSMAQKYSRDYEGGNWISKKMDSDDELFFLTLGDDTKMYKIDITENQYNGGAMNAITYGLAIFTMCANQTAYSMLSAGKNNFAFELFAIFNYCMMSAKKILPQEELEKYELFLS